MRPGDQYATRKNSVLHVVNTEGFRSVIEGVEGETVVQFAVVGKVGQSIEM